MIPKIIHLCWLSGDSFPTDIKKCLTTWKEQLCGYTVWLWGKCPKDTESLNCLSGLRVEEKHFDLGSTIWTKQAFEAKKYAFAADYIRLQALYNYGGIYLDADVLVYKPFDELLELPYFIGCDQIRAIEAAVMGCEPGCQWVKDMLDTYEGKHFVKPDGCLDTLELPVKFLLTLKEKDYRFYKVRNVEDASSFFSRNMDSSMCIFDRDFFNSRDAVEVRQTKKSFTAHNYAGSWQKKNDKKTIKDYLPKCVLKLIYVVGQATWAKKKYAWFQIPFEK